MKESDTSDTKETPMCMNPLPASQTQPARSEFDKDLDWELAFVEELETCSVESYDDFHLGRFLLRAAIRKHHDLLIEAWKYRMGFMRIMHQDLGRKVLASLERKKREAEARVAAKVAEEKRRFDRLVPYPEDPHERM
ncbi:MAG TPA: hypothetical protein VJC13_02430 [Candidatus Paceibacterota bacterium]